VGLFIVFEGGEGSGKSTQADRLVRRLAACATEVVATYEPGGTGVGEEIRRTLIKPRSSSIEPTTELLLFAAARAQLTREVLLPALQRGATVVCDRYAASSVAYQGYGRGIDLETVQAANQVATLGLTPDIVFLLDVPPGDALRRKSKTPDRFELETHGFHERVRQGYREMAAAKPETWVVLDALQSIDDTAAAIWSHVARLMESGPSARS
jgi:dTMP kinase